ncbi:MAG: helix-turn-helix domain-containing protein [Syntrophomonadaceae bacterium]
MEAKTYNLAEFIRFALQKSDLSAPHLAKILGVHRSTVNNWVNGGAEKIPFRLELAKDALSEYGINIGRITDTTVEVLPEAKARAQAFGGGDVTRQLGKLLEGYPLDGHLDSTRKECTCGQEGYIRSMELTIVHLVRENIGLRLQLYGDSMKRG